MPLVRRLVVRQFPQWGGLPVTPLVPGGWDNRTFRLGEDLLVRLPSGEGYAPQVDKEQTWLPTLAPRLPLRIPVPVARGIPAEDYPFNWSVFEWIDGEPAEVDRLTNINVFATTLADFLVAMQAIDSSNGPRAGAHSFFRGAPLDVYCGETLSALEALRGRIDTDKARAIWDSAIAAPFTGSPVWFHGDVAADNLLVDKGLLSSVIDFGCCGVGDPACDLVIAWTFFQGASRDVFRTSIDADEAAWARGRGWAMWKALITLASEVDSSSVEAAKAHHVINEILAE